MDPMQPFDPRHFVKGARDVQYDHKFNLITGKTGLILDLVIWRSLRGCPFSESWSVWMPRLVDILANPTFSLAAGSNGLA